MIHRMIDDDDEDNDILMSGNIPPNMFSNNKINISVFLSNN